MHTRSTWLAAAVLFALSATSSAATVPYSSAASFIDRVMPGDYSESFDAMAPSARTFFSGGGHARSVAVAGRLYGPGDFLGTDIANSPLTIGFISGSVIAIGGHFDVCDFTDARRTMAVALALNDNTVVTIRPTSLADSDRGCTSALRNHFVDVSTSCAFASASVDHVTVSVSEVLEPDSPTLMALNLSELFAARQSG